MHLLYSLFSKLFIGGLKWDTSKESLRSHFEKFGSINECVIMMDPMTGKSRGFGFITFADPKSIDRILKQDHVVDGKIVSRVVVTEMIACC